MSFNSCLLKILLAINLDNQTEACDLINQLRLEITEEVNFKIGFLTQLLDNYHPKKKQKIEISEKSEKETIQTKKQEIGPALKNALLEMIVVQKETAVTAQNNIVRIIKTLEMIEGNQKQKPVPDLMYI